MDSQRWRVLLEQLPIKRLGMKGVWGETGSTKPDMARASLQVQSPPVGTCCWATNEGSGGSEREPGWKEDQLGDSDGKGLGERTAIGQ